MNHIKSTEVCNDHVSMGNVLGEIILLEKLTMKHKFTQTICLYTNPNPTKEFVCWILGLEEMKKGCDYSNLTWNRFLILFNLKNSHGPGKNKNCVTKLNVWHSLNDWNGGNSQLNQLSGYTQSVSGHCFEHLSLEAIKLKANRMNECSAKL